MTCASVVTFVWAKDHRGHVKAEDWEAGWKCRASIRRNPARFSRPRFGIEDQHFERLQREVARRAGVELQGLDPLVAVRR